jgi:O-acetylserine/cysteine efflux transporter
MSTDRRRAVAALTAAGLLWGTTVPLSKLALGWLPPGWLTLLRFGLAAAILLVAARRQLRAAWSLPVLASGAAGYGGAVLLQNAGIARTSVSHAALLIGATPVLVAVIAARWHRAVARPVAWAGFAVSLAGVGLVADGGGGGATIGGDGLVLGSLLLSAMFTVAQDRLLRGRDPVAVTAVQFVGAALAALPFSVVAEGMPAVPGAPGPVLATAGLVAGGTLLPFTLFAYAQSRVAAEVAGAFFNIEPLVGAVAGIVVFGNPAGPGQVIGGAAILGGIALSSLPLIGAGRTQAQEQQRPEDTSLRPGDARLRAEDARLRAEDGGRQPAGARSWPASDLARRARRTRRAALTRYRSRRHLGARRRSASPRYRPAAARRSRPGGRTRGRSDPAGSRPAPASRRDRGLG